VGFTGQWSDPAASLRVSAVPSAEALMTEHEAVNDDPDAMGDGQHDHRQFQR
jgi:hypothetical protein